MATQEHAVQTLTVLAAGTITKNRFVTIGGVTATAAATAFGVAATSAASGEYFPVNTLGTSIVQAGGAISAGAAIEVGTGGKAVTKSSGVAVARAIEAASGDGVLIEVFLIPN